MPSSLLPSSNNLQKKNKTVFLINSPLKANMSEYTNDNAFPPLGIISVGTDIQHKTDWDVKVYDAQMMPMSKIEHDMERIRPSVVGLSVLADTYKPGLQFAEMAKRLGAITVFGNDQAALLGHNILKNQKGKVDAICTAEHGENMFVPFLQALETGAHLDTVPEMLYLDESGTIVNSSAIAPKLQGKHTMNNYEIPNRNLLPQKVWDDYLENYLKTYGFMHRNEVTGVSTMNSGRGCTRNKERCIYCGILDLSIKLSSPDRFWKEIESSKQQINANVFYEVFDSMSSVPNWIQELIKARPAHLADTKFIVYAQARDVNERTIELFKKLGVIMVNMGLDSGDDTMLKRLKSPKDSVATNKKAVELINEAGMHVFSSFVCGAPGETKQSLENTTNFIKWMADNRLAAAIEAQPLMPRKKSKIGNWFDNPTKAKADMDAMGLRMKNAHRLASISPAWNNDDIVDTPKMAEIYADVFTEVSYEQLIEASNKMVDYAKSKEIGAGSVGIEVDQK